MLDDKEITKIRDLREKGLTIKEISKAISRSESSVKKYLSDDYDKDNEIDGRTGKALNDRMLEEEYNFEDEVRPLVYSLKIQANSIDITLFDYLTDIRDTMSNFLKITDNPERFYYVFMELANNLSGFTTNNIEANDLMNAVNQWFDRETEIENAEAFITEIETKTEKLVENAKEEYNYWQEKINEAQNEHDSTLNKMKNASNTANLKKRGNEIKELQKANQILIEKYKILKQTLEQTDNNNKTIKHENRLLSILFTKINEIFPEQINDIVQEIDNKLNNIEHNDIKAQEIIVQE